MSYAVPSTPVEHNDLEQLKRQAKDLLKALKSSEPSALELARKHYRGALPGEFQLAEAQTIIARHHGFESWAKLRAEVDAVNLKRLAAAVRAGDLKEAGRLLKQRPELVNFDMAENDERRVLHFAVLQRDEPMVRLLVKAGADAHKGIYPHREPTTAHALAREREFPEIVAAIEEEEAFRREDMSCPNATISPVQEELARAIRQGDNEAALALLKNDPTLARACDRDGGTALHIACEAGATPVIDWLLEHHANCRKTNLKGWTPLEHALLALPAEKRKDFPVIAKKLMRHGAEIKPLVAAALGDIETLLQLHRQNPAALAAATPGWGQGGGVIGTAVLYGQTAALRALLDLGLDPNEPQPLAYLETEIVSRGGPLSGAASSGQYEMAALLLERGADPNAVVYASGGAMDWAYRERDDRMLKLLARHGGIPSAVSIGSFREIADAEKLLEKNPPEKTIAELLWAAASGGSPEIVRMCLDRIAWSASDLRWFSILTQPLRIWNHSPLNPHPELYDRSTYPECLRLLLAHGANPNLAGKRGDTLLHNIAAMGMVWGVEVMTAEERRQFAQIALQYNPDLTLRDHLLKSTPLAWACRWGRTELVQLLVESGASVDEPEAEPWATPLAWAKKMGHGKIADFLTSRQTK